MGIPRSSQRRGARKTVEEPVASTFEGPERRRAPNLQSRYTWGAQQETLRSRRWAMGTMRRMSMSDRSSACSTPKRVHCVIEVKSSVVRRSLAAALALSIGQHHIEMHTGFRDGAWRLRGGWGIGRFWWHDCRRIRRGGGHKRLLFHLASSSSGSPKGHDVPRWSRQGGSAKLADSFAQAGSVEPPPLRWRKSILEAPPAGNWWGFKLCGTPHTMARGS